MSMFARFLVSLVLLAPSLAHTATLGNPANGSNYSGVNVISGWKCWANGPLTVRFDGGDPIPLVYGTERTDVRAAGQCLENDHDNVGFVAIWNLSKLDSGEHTAVAYDNGVEFARSTFTVARASEESEFLRGVTAQCSVFDFPDVGTNARFEWSEYTQHLELAEVGEDVEVPVSTAFDGEWDFVMELTTNVFERETCDCYSGLRGTALSIKNGKAALTWNQCGSQNFELTWYLIVSPTGQLESSFGQESEDNSWLPFGSFDGFLYDDGTGGGQWIHILGCHGSWSFQRHEAS